MRPQPPTTPIRVPAWLLGATALVTSALVPLPNVAAEADGLFDARVAPLLARRCLSCHNAPAKKGGLDLSREAAARAGGRGGRPIVPGKPDESLLWRRVAANEMPPKAPLSTEERQLLRAWIAGGARWGTDPIDPFLHTSDHRAGYDWWSLQPVRKSPTPKASVPSWPRNAIDPFILAKLEAAGLSPTPEAQPRTLIRRLYFDLIGLPPSPEEMEEWGARLAAPDAGVRETAYWCLVDRLLASPHYGERWARHWLDVVRFGESQGFERNKIRENAWRYRDWVIRSFNDDLPYDEFVRRQIAGDALYPGNLEALIATGYHVCGTWDQVGFLEGSAEMRKAVRQDDLEDHVATLGQTFLGLTVHCARCHDHKFDPIAQREFYQLGALLGGVTQEEKERQGIKATEPPGPAPRFAGVAHVIIPKQPPVFHLLGRGDYRQPLDVVAPAGLKAVARSGLSWDFGLKPDAPEAQRRVRLAGWLTDPRNPLTPRVLVNRLWHYHFGRGIVDTPSDFGFAGGRPSHPELLDTLAATFVEGGWKVKDVQRLIVTSATYRQASNIVNSRAGARDADNRLLWRAPSRRLEGEAIRDAVLAVSGALNRRLGGPSYRDMKVDGGVMGTNAEFTVPTGAFGTDVNRRTVYRLWARSGNLPMLESLDCPDPSVMTPRRTVTVTPVQALTLLNSRFMEQCAARLAERVRGGAGGQIERTYAAILCREPRPPELELARRFLRDHPLEQLCLVLFNTNEFLFVE